MPKKRFSAEQIVVLLRQIEVLMSQGKATPVACREAGISQQRAARRMPQRRNLLQSERSHRRHRAVAQALQHDPAALILELSAARAPNIHSLIVSTGSELRNAIISKPLVQNIRQVSNTSEKEPNSPKFPVYFPVNRE